MRLSTEIRNKRMMGFLSRGKTPKEVARRFHITVWAVYKAQKEMEKAGQIRLARDEPALSGRQNF